MQASGLIFARYCLSSSPNLNGEVSERLKEHAWKVCVRLKAYRGFESLPLRHLPAQQGDGSS